MKYNTIFLDRDGVINKQIINGYVTTISEFEFLPKALEALSLLAKKFQYIFIVTNQQSIGKGIINEDDLQKIHEFMLQQIIQNGGRIDKIYVAPYLESENNIHRKPNAGLAWQAKKEYPDIDFKRSIMVGDSMSDMQFGKNAGMTTVLLTHEIFENRIMVDFLYQDLHEFAMNSLKIFE